MKKLLLFALLAAAITALPAHAQERIATYDTIVTISSTGSVGITENIVYDFGDAERHGIFRDIPVRYQGSLGKYSVSLSAITVTDEKGTPYSFSTSRQGSSLRVKIGDPNLLISGVHLYRISYVMDGAIGFFKDHDELYWNAIGPDWEVPIGSATAIVKTPPGVPTDTLQMDCFSAAYGGTEACNEKKIDSAQGIVDHVYFGENNLEPYQAFTVVVGFPKGIVREPSTVEKILKFMKDNWFVAIPILAFVLMFYLWYTRGRDPKGRGTIIAEYDPPEGLSPAQVGGLVDQSVQDKDIAAEIIELAVRGFLRIESDEKKDYTLTQLKPKDDSMTLGQQELFEGLFAGAGAGSAQQVRLVDLKDKFYKTLIVVKTWFASSLVSGGYESARPELVRAGYIALASLLVFIGFFVAASVSLVAMVSLLVSAGIIAGFGWAMPKRTYKGVLAWEKILGFREYLRVVEKDRLKFHNAPEKKPEIFEKCLPYAMVLGVEKEWAAQFKDIYTQEPSWYHDSYGRQFNTILLVQNLNTFSASAHSTLASAPSSGGSGLGGGGFSGGGFGGGGGGSW